MLQSTEIYGYRSVFQELKRSRFGQILLFDAATDNLERNLVPVADENEINVAENKFWSLFRKLTSGRFGQFKRILWQKLIFVTLGEVAHDRDIKLCRITQNYLQRV
jgi:hypothetical protein